jgi:hypothetical protein
MCDNQYDGQADPVLNKVTAPSAKIREKESDSRENGNSLNSPD